MSRKWNRSTRRLATLIGLLTALALLVAACGDADDEEEAVDEPDEAEEPEEPDEAEEAEEPEEPDEPDAAEAFEGEEMTWIVPYSPGGGFDTQLRLVAPFLEEALGVAGGVVVNEPGAGGLLAHNDMVRGDPDPLAVGILNGTGALSAQLAEDAALEFDLRDLSYVGRVGGPPNVIITSPEGEYDTIEDVMAADEFVFATPGVGSASHLNAVIHSELLDITSSLVPGYEGTTEAELSVMAGETDGLVMPFDSAIDNIQAGETQPVLFIAEEPVEGFEDVPLATDVPDDPDVVEMLEIHTSLLALFRVLVTHPDVSDAELQYLRDAFDSAVVDNPDLDEAAEAQDHTIEYLSGEEVEELVPQILDAPDEYVDLARQAYED